KSEMPVKYWRNLPEAELIPSLIRTARDREQKMLEREASQPPSRHLRQAARSAETAAGGARPVASLAEAREEVQACRRCPLHEMATQAVFGEGPARADVMFVGEQPGDQEDLAGRPFVGPAGRVLDEVLAEVGIDRRRVYGPNDRDHSKFEPR